MQGENEVKHIVFCADGTWNGPPAPDVPDIDGASKGDGDVGNVTNVWKLFANLKGVTTPDTVNLRCEQERKSVDTSGAVTQIAKYLHGVGDTGELVLKAIGGVFGAGVIARIVRGYTFISRNYSAGDLIHIVGFSRGAYTARALAGMICAVGLLNPKKYDSADKLRAYTLGFGAWLQARGVVFGGGNTLARWFTGGAHEVELFFPKLLLSKGDFVSQIPVRSVAVWDTVGSLGLPLYIKDQRRDAFSFVDTKLNPQVARGFHAMALDERRLDFPVTRWVPRDGIEQVWFSGCHSDVGGGYPSGETGLSDIALDWMISRLSGEGVAFGKPLAIAPDLTHLMQDFHKPWEQPPFNIDPRPRAPEQGDAFHPTVRERWLASAQYRGVWPSGCLVAQMLEQPLQSKSALV